MREKLNEQEYQDKYACRIQIIEPVFANIRLVQEHGWFLNKLSKILRILQFLIGSCSKTEVF
jgi:hypothetical protein